MPVSCLLVCRCAVTVKVVVVSRRWCVVSPACAISTHHWHVGDGDTGQVALNITSFSVACPAALVIRSAANLSSGQEFGFCDRKAAPFVTPFTSASTGLYVSIVGGPGTVVATVITGQV